MKQYASPCGGCKCYSCANSSGLSSKYFTAGEANEACFKCEEECYYYDHGLQNNGIRKKILCMIECADYVEAIKYTNTMAESKRKKFKLLGGDEE